MNETPSVPPTSKKKIVRDFVLLQAFRFFPLQRATYTNCYQKTRSNAISGMTGLRIFAVKIYMFNRRNV